MVPIAIGGYNPRNFLQEAIPHSHLVNKKKGAAITIPCIHCLQIRKDQSYEVLIAQNLAVSQGSHHVYERQISVLCQHLQQVSTTTPRAAIGMKVFNDFAAVMQVIKPRFTSVIKKISIVFSIEYMPENRQHILFQIGRIDMYALTCIL